jgi:type IV secretion system protein VirB9
MKCLALLAALVMALPAAPLVAQLRPTPGPGDPRLQTVVYDPDQVVQLTLEPGYQLLVSFEPGEAIETIAVGDSGGWSVAANKRGDSLFIKALRGGGASNLTVVSDARTYNFELVAGGGGEVAYSVRFVYPTNAEPVSVGETRTLALAYRLSGAKALRPKNIAIESDRILLDFAEGAPLPAMYRREADGAETLINGEMREGRFVVEGVPEQIVFRLDRARAVARLSVLRRTPR